MDSVSQPINHFVPIIPICLCTDEGPNAILINLIITGSNEAEVRVAHIASFSDSSALVTCACHEMQMDLLNYLGSQNNYARSYKGHRQAPKCKKEKKCSKIDV